MEEYKLPKNVRERLTQVLEQNPDADITVGQGHAYSGRQVQGKYSIGHGQNLWSAAQVSEQASVPVLERKAIDDANAIVDLNATNSSVAERNKRKPVAMEEKKVKKEKKEKKEKSKEKKEKKEVKDKKDKKEKKEKSKEKIFTSGCNDSPYNTVLNSISLAQTRKNVEDEDYGRQPLSWMGA